MKKRTYIQPATTVVNVAPTTLLVKASQIENGQGSGSGNSQWPVDDNEDDDFEMGAKGHRTNLWDDWDE